jgi:F-type H+-transporting ATPase subunit delta
MKVNTKKYAVALYEAVKEADGKKLNLVLTNFVKLLAKSGLINQSDKILNDFNRYYNDQEGIVEVELTTAQAISPAETNSAAKALEKILGKKVELKCKLEQDLIGGAIFKFNDLLIDGSLKSRFKEIKEQMIKT